MCIPLDAGHTCSLLCAWGSLPKGFCASLMHMLSVAELLRTACKADVPAWSHARYMLASGSVVMICDCACPQYCVYRQQVKRHDIAVHADCARDSGGALGGSLHLGCAGACKQQTYQHQQRQLPAGAILIPSKTCRPTPNYV